MRRRKEYGSLDRLFPGLTVSIAAGCLLSAACAGPPPAEPDVVRPVRYVSVEATGQWRTRTLSGVARARAESSLSFQVAGTIASVTVAVGDRVQAGAPIARLDAEDYGLQVREAEAALRQAEAMARNAAANLRRGRALYEKGNASATDLDAALATADSAAARVDALGRQLDLARLRVRRTQLIAPEDGSIADVLVAANEHVTAGQPVVVLTSGATPEVEFAVPEGLIRQIRRGTPVSVTFGAIPGVRFDGAVTEAGVAAMTTSTMFPVAASLDAGPAVWPGMAARVTLELDDGGDAVERFVLPSQAVGEDRHGPFVFVAEPAGVGRAVVRRRAVTIGDFVSGGLEIVEGLSAGARVVSGGVSRIADGDIVSLDAAWTAAD